MPSGWWRKSIWISNGFNAWPKRRYPLKPFLLKWTPSETASTSDRPTIGILRDSAFQFYYPENLEALEAAGARLVYASPLTDRHLPPVDALYIGGGFPETHARELEQNTTFKNELKGLADKGLPIYAECGGLMYLGEKLQLEAGSFEMTGVLPAVFGFSKRPQGHGYTIVQVEKENPYFPIGTKLLGHEFHYSSVKEWKGREENLSFSMQRGAGFIGWERRGLCQQRPGHLYPHSCFGHASVGKIAGGPCVVVSAGTMNHDQIYKQASFLNGKSK
jgi:cobyrinic acid a,c-diamide synthase